MSCTVFALLGLIVICHKKYRNHVSLSTFLEFARITGMRKLRHAKSVMLSTNLIDVELLTTPTTVEASLLPTSICCGSLWIWCTTCS